MLRMQDRLAALERLNKSTGWTDEELEEEYEKIMSDAYARDYAWAGNSNWEQIYLPA